MEGPVLRLNGTMSPSKVPESGIIRSSKGKYMIEMFMRITLSRDTPGLILAGDKEDRLGVGALKRIYGDTYGFKDRMHSYVRLPENYRRKENMSISVELYHEPIDENGTTLVISELVHTEGVKGVDIIEICRSRYLESIDRT